MTNERQRNVHEITGVCTHPTVPAAGGPCRIGGITGVAKSAKDAGGNTVVAIDGIFQLSVKGTTGSSSAVAIGDKLYYVDADTPPVSKTTSGNFIGYALATVGSGATAIIDVLVGPVRG